MRRTNRVWVEGRRSLAEGEEHQEALQEIHLSVFSTSFEGEIMEMVVFLNESAVTAFKRTC